jgi:hypothetical protein
MSSLSHTKLTRKILALLRQRKNTREVAIQLKEFYPGLTDDDVADIAIVTLLKEIKLLVKDRNLRIRAMGEKS